MEHPLARHIEAIDPKRHYDSAEVAALLGVGSAALRPLVLAGWLPEPQVPRRSGRGGQPVRRWRGSALRTAGARKRLKPLDHDQFAGTTLWRLGCRCASCTAAHSERSRLARRAAADAAFPEADRELLLAAVAAGADMKSAAELVGVSTMQVYGRATRDPVFSARLDEAGAALCVDAASGKCGTPTGYRSLRCRGTACRRAHTPTTH
ncbi:hypothetical protein [Streptacidiphilus cavernicola]|uniref:DNA-binding protein n=1 Tax=Streptacidiphilus cavernicola TaxID=3342716 RepID=A0ABV6VY26_9ACTN